MKPPLGVESEWECGLYGVRWLGSRPRKEDRLGVSASLQHCFPLLSHTLISILPFPLLLRAWSSPFYLPTNHSNRNK
ncbi:Cutinase transcription factor 1 alpha [Fusarium oxysporum f. sp. albedinis]|nr:Cutinase transcription factor 1 alpha [Fusarium oxysporum f. sp. albedinis]